jgi:hypothetical protein
MGVAIWVALRELSTSLGVFAVLLIGFSLAMIAMVDHERARSYLDPRMQWFEGRPRFIPGMRAAITPTAAEPAAFSDSAPWRVARLDREGVFLFECSSPVREIPPFILSDARVKLMLEFHGTRVSVEGEPVTVLTSRRGVGLKLRPGTLDESTGLGLLVEAVRGVGYGES